MTLDSYRGKAVAALEIGAFQGKATTWLLQHILVHPQASITVLDTWLGSDEHTTSQSSCLLEIFLHNTQPYGSKVKPMQGRSEDMLRQLPVEPTYHIVYVDGDHTARGVFNDAMLSFPLLHVGGMLIFDDFLWIAPPYAGGRSTTSWDAPMPGIIAFFDLHVQCLQLQLVGYQLFMKKVCSDTVFGTHEDYPPSVFGRGLQAHANLIQAHPRDYTLQDLLELLAGRHA